MFLRHYNLLDNEHILQIPCDKIGFDGIWLRLLPKVFRFGFFETYCIDYHWGFHIIFWIAGITIWVE